MRMLLFTKIKGFSWIINQNELNQKKIEDFFLIFLKIVKNMIIKKKGWKILEFVTLGLITIKKY